MDAAQKEMQEKYEAEILELKRQHLSKAGTFVSYIWSFVLYERPILGYHPKAHSEKHCGFHEKQWFSLKSGGFH